LCRQAFVGVLAHAVYSIVSCIPDTAISAKRNTIRHIGREPAAHSEGCLDIPLDNLSDQPLSLTSTT
jgi:hypothetical protein